MWVIPEQASGEALAPWRTCSIRRQWFQATLMASSKSSTPAVQAAATSPELCPVTASGRMPQLSNSLTSAIWRAKLQGWATTDSSTREWAASVVICSTMDQFAY